MPATSIHENELFDSHGTYGVSIQEFLQYLNTPYVEDELCAPKMATKFHLHSVAKSIQPRRSLPSHLNGVRVATVYTIRDLARLPNLQHYSS